MQMKKFVRGLGLGLVSASATVPAFAAVDVSAVVTEINSAVAPVGLIGTAVLLVFVTVAVYKWVRRAL